jgi:hypothetical protein
MMFTLFMGRGWQPKQTSLPTPTLLRCSIVRTPTFAGLWQQISRKIWNFSRNDPGSEGTTCVKKVVFKCFTRVSEAWDD